MEHILINGRHLLTQFCVACASKLYAALDKKYETLVKLGVHIAGPIFHREDVFTVWKHRRNLHYWSLVNYSSRANIRCVVDTAHTFPQ